MLHVFFNCFIVGLVIVFCLLYCITIVQDIKEALYQLTRAREPGDEVADLRRRIEESAHEVWIFDENL